jgi:hypothetical protein
MRAVLTDLGCFIPDPKGSGYEHFLIPDQNPNMISSQIPVLHAK